MSILTVNRLTKTFGSGHTEVRAVADISLNIEASDIVLVMGPSGSGKTTLISMIGTLMRPTSGVIMLDGQDVTKLSPGRLAYMRLTKLGFVFQGFNLIAALDAEQNVMLPMLANRTNRQAARQKARKLLEHLGVGERLRHLPKDLSGGEKQRVAIARALINDPELVLADEPTANLDTKNGLEVMKLLCNIACAENKAVIIVSHDERLRDVAKRVITIQDGKLLNEETGNHNENCPVEHNHA